MATRTLLCCLLLISSLLGHTQSVVDLQENTAYKNNGLEYGYYIANERPKEVKGEEHDRFEVVLYINNYSGCARIIPLLNNTSGTSSNTDETLLADFTIKNATGKRLTAKSGKINARPWYTQVKLSDGTKVQAQVGYILRHGESITNKIIVIVPKGERPNINCRMIYLPE